MAFVRSGNGGGGGTLQDTSLANFTISASGSTTKSIGVSGARIVAIYGNVTYSQTFVILGIPTKSAIQIGESSGYRDSTTLFITFSDDSFTISNTLSSTATMKNIKVLYEV